MKRSDFAAILFFLALAVVFFAPVLSGDATLAPFDNLYRFPPWNAFAAQNGVTQSYNPLLDDLILENYAWKSFIRESLRAGEIPLWNPYILAGQPFLAAGQNATLYPLGIVFYVLPLARAYAVFAVLHYWLAACAMYFLARVLGLRAFAATVSSVIYAFGGFMVVSIVFPMVVSAATWLPAILAFTELTLRNLSPDPSPNGRGEKGRGARALFFALCAGILVGLQFLAGHVEVSYYILLVLAFYAAWRILGRNVSLRARTLNLRGIVRAGAVMLGIVVLGFALAAIQILPLYELARLNFREGSASYADVAGWALPSRQILTFFMPDFFGNPTHHAYFDIFDFTWRAAPQGTIFWGIKNYVEAGAYIGILAMVLAVVAVIQNLKFKIQNPSPDVPPERLYVQPPTSNLQFPTSNLQFPTPNFQFPTPNFQFRTPNFQLPISNFQLPISNFQFPISNFQFPISNSIWFLAILAIVSLLFAFGTPLYALLFYGLPGWNQLHTAFRWIFPWTLAMAFLAGVGAETLTLTLSQNGRGNLKRVVVAFGVTLIVVGALALFVVALSLAMRDVFLRFADAFVNASDLAKPVFETGRAFWSYEARNVALFGAFVLLAGIVLLVARANFKVRGVAVWKPLALFVLVLDLFVAGMGFYPRADAKLAEFVPPAIQFLQQDKSLYRIATYDERGQKVLNANSAMPFGIQDIRGYDSIIPKQYVEYMSLLAPQDELLYNRIAALYDYQPLSSPLLNLLGVKYILTTRPAPNPGYELVYDREIKIYKNKQALPRAWLVGGARVYQNRSELLDALQSFNQVDNRVLLEGDAPILQERSTDLPQVLIEKYTGSEVVAHVELPHQAYFILFDSYFPGWIAQIDGQDTPIYRADGNFRAVVVPAGEHTVRFKYSPLAFRVGSVLSLLAVITVLLALVALVWQRFVLQRGEGDSQVHTVAKNSLVPMGASLLIQVINFALALVVLRILGPENNGRYAFAVTVWFFLSAISEFGLGILSTREVARDRSKANVFLTNSIVLRMGLTLLSIVLLAGVIAFYTYTGDMNAATIGAMLLLWVSLFPNNLAGALSGMFYAFERFEYPTAVEIATALVSVVLQIAVLLAGYGIVGLAGVSIATNLFTLGVLFYLVRRLLFKPHFAFDRKLARWMFFESFPLMMNNLLANLFFKIDVFLLLPLTSPTVLGYYNAAYKFVNALNFIPSKFTLAIFPMLSRLSTSSTEAMQRALIMSVKLLVWIAVPITVATVFITEPLILIFAGAAYLPDSAIALQWLIFFLPFSFINSVVHYVLIALNEQRFLTRAFLIGLAFNVAANWIAIPPLTYRGAALVTVLSEFALLIPFYYALRKHIAPLPILDMFWRPAVAGLLMGGVLYLLVPQNLILALLAATLVYGAALLLLGALGPDEWLLVQRLLPKRVAGFVGKVKSDQ
ncbi:MAG: oligosaccharide flippase family protein [Chloroflexi bacterium]|nr:oligosaccharide flippase family protein [Chloroflexota bacterium]